MYQDGTDERERRIELEESQRAAQLEIQQLRQQLQIRDQEKQQDNQQIQQQGQQVQQQGQQIQELQEQTQDTTIFEYVRSCYEILYSRLAPETNRRLMTGKSTVHHRGRPHPRQMRVWNNFLGEQQGLFEEIFNAFPLNYRGFTPIIGLENIEWNVDHFISLNIEDPVKKIFEKLSLHAHGIQGLEELRVDGIRIEFVRSSLDTSEPQRGAAGERPAPTARRDTAQLQPDSFCVVSRPGRTEGSREMTFVSEFKTFSVCSEEDAREIFVPRRNFGPTHLEEMQLKVAQISIVCQAYQYVMQSFTGFGILTTGKVFVFLRVDWDEPGVLYFHVSTPDVDVQWPRKNNTKLPPLDTFQRVVSK
ncbi:hypothetical protein E4U14_005804 [Claviceps sp. LM454 group G7]|nr:hypothetical protein E4U14_005804 [Claviceps sp. LM454 group G7]